MGKTFELTFADQLSHDEIEHEVNEICDRMLANFNMENYRYEISDSEAIQ